ncbi:hypothetical protein BCO37747_06627 [Burkholderia contaminans]|nr:hypothetical protein SK875_A03268 [Burkholderia contaminans]VWC09357.1 hypothetical protein BCO23253_05323 [Burkholderia contaminans]VWD55659.1 hypothetical protein BCO37747_06627 [Burkholderia contaminans]
MTNARNPHVAARIGHVLEWSKPYVFLKTRLGSHHD